MIKFQKIMIKMFILYMVKAQLYQSRVNMKIQFYKWIKHYEQIHFTSIPQDTKVFQFLPLGEALIMMKKYQASIQYFDKALAIDSQNFHSICCKGEALQFLGQYLCSMKWLDKALFIDPEDPFTLECKGYTLEKMPMIKEAIISFRLALINPKAYYYLH